MLVYVLPTTEAHGERAVDRRYRGHGVAKLALNTALESIKKPGGGIVEANPVVSKKMAAVPEWRWFGTLSMFVKEGFLRVAPLGTSGRPHAKDDFVMPMYSSSLGFDMKT